MNITQLSDDKVLISLCQDDMKSFKLDFDTIAMTDPHSKKIVSRLLSLAITSSGLCTQNKVIMLEALQNTEGCLLLVSLNDKKQKRKKYRIKRIRNFPCYRFSDCESMLSVIKKLYNTNIMFYNNSAYSYMDKYYLVFDYPVVAKSAKVILSEYCTDIKATKPFIARLNECGTNISKGNAIAHIGASL